MDNFNNGYQPVYTAQPNYYYQGTQTIPIYNPPRNQNGYTSAPLYQTQNISNNNSNLIWVQGENAAKSWYVPNGGRMVFFDSEEEKIYIKSVDASGKPEMSILYYSTSSGNEDKKGDETTAAPVYATKEQVDDLTAKLSSISGKFDTLGNFATKDQLDNLNNYIDNLSNQIEDIQNRMMSFGKPQANNRKGNNNGKSSV